MLPLSEQWYRRLLATALLLGLVGGVLALVYSGVTEAGISRLFGTPTSEPFSGQWWWVPLIAGGALVVAFLRARAGLDGPIPGAIAYAQRGWVEPGSAPALFLISAISLIVGASLGPSFGIVVSAGGFASWLASRHSDADEAERQDYSLTGMAGGLGAIFSAPLFASVMASELSPTSKRDYVAAFVPQFTAATIGYMLFFGLTGKLMLDSFDIPGYSFEWSHLLMAVGLGLASVMALLLYMAIGAAAKRVGSLITNSYVVAVAFGALVGLIAFALPLTATGGSHQLSFEVDHVDTLGAGLLAAVLVAKMVAVHLSLGAGFLGGTVFPMLFIGGTAGVLVHTLIPEIPAALAVAAMIAAVPGAVIGAPVSFILIGVGTVGLGVEAIAPIGIAVLVAHISAGVLQSGRGREQH
jgi:H+/Cl- antiporter ClcA